MLVIILLVLVILLYYYPVDNQEIARKLVRQIARWTLAAEQDKNPIIAALHANYGAGYLWALKDLVPEREINLITDFRKLEKRVTDTQTDVTKRLTKMCPDLVPKDTYLYSLGGDV